MNFTISFGVNIKFASVVGIFAALLPAVAIAGGGVDLLQVPSGGFGGTPPPQSVGQYPLVPRNPAPFPRPVFPRRPPARGPLPPVIESRPGIMVRWQDGPTYYPAKVLHVVKDWYHVAYEDGDEEAVRAEQISKYDPSVAVHSKAGVGSHFGPPTQYFKPGQRVRGAWRALRSGGATIPAFSGGGDAPTFNGGATIPAYSGSGHVPATFPGVILEASNNWYHVLYDDHDQEVTLGQFLTPDYEAPTHNFGFAEPTLGN
jgi:hypothetical protein